MATLPEVVDGTRLAFLQTSAACLKGEDSLFKESSPTAFQDSFALCLISAIDGTDQELSDLFDCLTTPVTPPEPESTHVCTTFEHDGLNYGPYTLVLDGVEYVGSTIEELIEASGCELVKTHNAADIYSAVDTPARIPTPYVNQDMTVTEVGPGALWAFTVSDSRFFALHTPAGVRRTDFTFSFTEPKEALCMAVYDLERQEFITPLGYLDGQPVGYTIQPDDTSVLVDSGTLTGSSFSRRPDIDPERAVRICFDGPIDTLEVEAWDTSRSARNILFEMYNGAASTSYELKCESGSTASFTDSSGITQTQELTPC